tara:strand:- start:23 stop:748 length:726 start_codon:yes stop_codon:yes gene_type:complete
MPLPTIETPTYELKLPSSNKKIKYRPFLVKEEKILILALESKSQNEITNAVTDVLKKCILTRGIKVDDLPTFDIEYLFLNIRAKSIGEDIKLTVTCPDDGETKVPVTIYVDEIKVIKPKDHKIDIVLDDKMSLRMKYPSLNQFIESNFDTEDEAETMVDKTFRVVADCMDTIFDGEDAWEAKDYSAQERLDFVQQLNSQQYKKVENFFSTMPKLSHTIEVVNPNTKEKGSVVLEGLADFFG